jgi:hypothetical protein
MFGPSGEIASATIQWPQGLENSGQAANVRISRTCSHL